MGPVVKARAIALRCICLNLVLSMLRLHPCLHCFGRALTTVAAVKTITAAHPGVSLHALLALLPSPRPALLPTPVSYPSALRATPPGPCSCCPLRWRLRRSGGIPSDGSTHRAL